MEDFVWRIHVLVDKFGIKVEEDVSVRLIYNLSKVDVEFQVNFVQILENGILSFQNVYVLLVSGIMSSIVSLFHSVKEIK